MLGMADLQSLISLRSKEVTLVTIPAASWTVTPGYLRLVCVNCGPEAFRPVRMTCPLWAVQIYSSRSF
jgi:hypothetical protein